MPLVKISLTLVKTIEKMYPKIGHLTATDINEEFMEKMAARMYKVVWGESVEDTLSHAKL